MMILLNSEKQCIYMYRGRRRRRAGRRRMRRRRRRAGRRRMRRRMRSRCVYL
jgi:hypothetical protein